MSVTTGINPNPDGSITITFDQSAAETSVILASQGAKQRIVVVGFLASIDAAGTFKWVDSAAENLSGIFDLGASAPFGWKGTVKDPLFTLDKNTGLSLITTGGAASGFVKVEVISGT